MVRTANSDNYNHTDHNPHIYANLDTYCNGDPADNDIPHPLRFLGIEHVDYFN